MTNTKKLLRSNILSLLGLEDISDKAKKDFAERTGRILQKRILLNILKSFSSEDKKNKFLKAVENDKSEQIDQILEDSDIDLDDITETEILQLKYDLIS